jgi:hypothetical protein
LTALDILRPMQRIPVELWFHAPLMNLAAPCVSDLFFSLFNQQHSRLSFHERYSGLDLSFFSTPIALGANDL